MKVVLTLVLLLAPLAAWASPEEEWAAIVAMDAGPQRKPVSQEDAKSIARRHLLAQEDLLGKFLSRYPADPRAFDARLRLAGILAAIGNMDQIQQSVDEAMRIFISLEKAPDVPMEKRADAGFQRVSLYFQSMRGREVEMRSSIVDAAKNFVAKYPGDRRGPRLLVEAATICDSEPLTKRQLLEEARSLSKEPALNRRIADDLVRLSLLNQPIGIKFKTLQGQTFDSAAEKGRVVVVVFWSADSPHSLVWLPEFIRAMRQFPPSRVQIATVSLDTNQALVVRRLKELGISSWPTFFDGNGWESALARSRGINALPTVFVIDKSGVLRSINARDHYQVLIRQLLRE